METKKPPSEEVSTKTLGGSDFRSLRDFGSLARGALETKQIQCSLSFLVLLLLERRSP